MNVLVLNSGNLTIRFQFISTDLEAIKHNADKCLASGTVERIGGEVVITTQIAGHAKQRTTSQLRRVRAAISHVVHCLLGVLGNRRIEVNG